MRILAVDTSTIAASVAIMENDKLLIEYFVDSKENHSQKIVPMIDEVLRNMGMKPYDIDLFAVITGPGSFTGLRIGVTTIKTMAYAMKKPVRGVTTLDTLAFNIPICDAIICPIINARNNQVYTALYQWKDGKQERITDYMGIDVGELIQKIKETIKDSNKKAFILGDGVRVYKEQFLKELKEPCLFPPENLMLQKASSVAAIVMNELKQCESNRLKEPDIEEPGKEESDKMETDKEGTYKEETDKKELYKKKSNKKELDIEEMDRQEPDKKGPGRKVPGKKESDRKETNIKKLDKDRPDRLAEPVELSGELKEDNLLDEINKLVPFYLRKSQAERLFNNAR